MIYNNNNNNNYYYYKIIIIIIPIFSKYFRKFLLTNPFAEMIDGYIDTM